MLRFLLCVCVVASAVSSSPKRHAVFIGASQRSHLIAAQGLAEEVARRGYKVSFAALESDRGVLTSVQGAGVSFISLGEPPHDAAYFHYTHDISDLFALCGEYSAHLYDTLLPKLRDAPPDVLVVDQLYWPAGYALSKELGVPSVMLVAGLAGLQFLGEEPDYVPMVISGLPAPVSGFFQRLKNFAMLRVARHVLQRVRASHLAPFLARVGLEGECPYGKSELAIHGSVLGLGETPRIQTILASPLLQSTGPWLPRSPAPALSDEVSAFLHGDTPVVLVAIGTNADLSGVVAEAIVGALLQPSPGFRVVWSMKDRHKEDVLAPAMKTLGSPRSDFLLVVPFVDQFTVLSHRNVKAFVSHCGFGSMQEALHTGTPMLAMPMMLESDQVTNAARAVQLGVALSFDARPGHDNITSSTFLAKIQTLVGSGDEGEHIRATAARLARHSSLMKGPQRAADWIEVAVEAGTSHMVPVEEKVHVVALYSVDVLAFFTVLAFVVVYLVRSVLCCLCCGKQKKD